MLGKNHTVNRNPSTKIKAKQGQSVNTKSYHLEEEDIDYVNYEEENEDYESLYPPETPEQGDYECDDYTLSPTLEVGFKLASNPKRYSKMSEEEAAQAFEARKREIYAELSNALKKTKTQCLTPGSSVKSNLTVETKNSAIKYEDTRYKVNAQMEHQRYEVEPKPRSNATGKPKLERNFSNVAENHMGNTGKASQKVIRNAKTPKRVAANQNAKFQNYYDIRCKERDDEDEDEYFDEENDYKAYSGKDYQSRVLVAAHSNGGEQAPSRKAVEKVQVQVPVQGIACGSYSDLYKKKEIQKVEITEKQVTKKTKNVGSENFYVMKSEQTTPKPLYQNQNAANPVNSERSKRSEGPPQKRRARNVEKRNEESDSNIKYNAGCDPLHNINTEEIQVAETIIGFNTLDSKKYNDKRQNKPRMLERTQSIVEPVSRQGMKKKKKSTKDALEIFVELENMLCTQNPKAVPNEKSNKTVSEAKSLVNDKKKVDLEESSRNMSILSRTTVPKQKEENKYRILLEEAENLTKRINISKTSQYNRPNGSKRHF
eukprot:TRINITY_DN4421_c0_g1_i12.p1 TRINITY_DN4421_c0_g1~~TRINITY_DN4421_c0_g1_i12.p1  ORF type:complete len:542 (+),score=119.34 TRINITY_DN4421_c0_g1_i12:76-1701(+)